jgi:hypothetical protein
MYKTLIRCCSAASGLAAFVIIVAVASAEPKASLAVASMQSVTSAAVLIPTEVPVQPEATSEKKDNAKVGQLADYLLTAMKSAVSPIPGRSASYEDIAHDIATVVLDPTEPPMWKDDSTKARTATMMVSIGFHETSFLAYVDDGRCNDRKWRASEEGRKTMGWSGFCDGGLAHSIWQVHPDRGGIYTIPANYDDTREINKQEWTYADQEPDDGTLVTPEGMLNRQSACRVALHIARRSIRSHARLCQFTGEMGDCPKGDIRYDWAEHYSRVHPFHFTEAQVSANP